VGAALEGGALRAAAAARSAALHGNRCAAGWMSRSDVTCRGLLHCRPVPTNYGAAPSRTSHPIRRINTPQSCSSRVRCAPQTGAGVSECTSSRRLLACGGCLGCRRYVILPTNVHFFCSPDRRTSPRRVVRYWKWLLGRRTAGLRLADGILDTQLRPWRKLRGEMEIRASHPVRHGLVAEARDGPYAGS